MNVVEPRLRPYAEPAARAALDARDRRLVETAFLYVCYQRHVPELDALIERQAAREDLCAADELADSVVGELVRRGFSEPQATRYFAIFFQLRRAYRFIVPSLAGECESMRRLRRALWDNVFTHDMDGYDRALWNRMEDFSTLLLGETGSGKGSAAAAIGRSEFIPYLPPQRRFAANFMHSFIAINLSQFPETLIESELFGHRKGAFTGAIEHHAGVFERCNAHGALFLDEIGEVSIPVQIKLLQVLQERTFTPLGSREARRFAGRVIAATNRPLDELRRAGRFRDDFYYRLCSDVIPVPPLRQRIEESAAELPLLVRLLVARICGTEDAEPAARVMESLERDLPRSYGWPGNVRELEQAVRRILLTGRYAAELAGSAADEESSLAEAVRSGRLNAKELLGRYCALLYRRCGSYAEVAERTGLDRRTARKYIGEGAAGAPRPAAGSPA
jgi:MoxR-like ATPase